MLWLSVQLKSPIISLCSLFPASIIVCIFSQKSGLSLEGAYTAKMSRVPWSGNVTVKNSVSLLLWLLTLVILHPLFFLRNISIPRFLVGFPWIVYLENCVRFLFLIVSSLAVQMWESSTILMSLAKSKNVFNFADSFLVPVLEVIVILLADFDFKVVIFVGEWGRSYAPCD